MTEANHAHGYAQDRFVHESGAFVAQAQAAKALEPGEGSLDHVTIHSQAAAMFLAALGQKGNDAVCPQPLAVGLAARARGADFELTLIGRTTAQWGSQVEAVLNTLQGAGRPVRWLRHVDDGTLRRAYKECAFSVFPSLAEGYGIPIVESPWYGRPCVCGVNGAIGEAAAGGGCLTIDQSDPATLAAALETLLADQTLYRRLCDEAAQRTFGTWGELARRLLPFLNAKPTV